MGLDFLVDSISLFGGMLDQLIQKAWVNRVDHVKEEAPVRRPALEELVGHEGTEWLVVLDELPDLGHAELVELRHGDELHLTHFEYLLVAPEQLLQEVLVDMLFRRQIILHYI